VPGTLEIIAHLCDAGIVPSLGHTYATFEEAQRGIEAGITHVTHVTNAMRSFHHREPAALGAVLMSDHLSMQVITDGVHIHPRVVRWLFELHGPDRCAIITDGMKAMGMPPGQYRYGETPFEIRDGAARYADGTLIGTACTQLELVRRALDFTDLPLHAAVRAASLTPARIIGHQQRKGSLDPGKDADILMCDRELNLQGVMLRGKIIE
jgi:N-acetylglucosamine-6-phosphate deacetylase